MDCFSKLWWTDGLNLFLYTAISKTKLMAPNKTRTVNSGQMFDGILAFVHFMVEFLKLVCFV